MSCETDRQEKNQSGNRGEVKTFQTRTGRARAGNWPVEDGWMGKSQGKEMYVPVYLCVFLPDFRLLRGQGPASLPDLAPHPGQYRQTQGCNICARTQHPHPHRWIVSEASCLATAVSQCEFESIESIVPHVAVSRGLRKVHTLYVVDPCAIQLGRLHVISSLLYLPTLRKKPCRPSRHFPILMLVVVMMLC